MNIIRKHDYIRDLLEEKLHEIQYDIDHTEGRLKRYIEEKEEVVQALRQLDGKGEISK